MCQFEETLYCGRWTTPTLVRLFACLLSCGGWTNFREFRLTETEGGGGDLCSRAIILTTA